jgi:hypothetical protein
MTDTCEVGHIGTTVDPDGFEVEAFVADWSSVCKVQSGGTSVREVDAAGRERALTRLEVHFPSDSLTVAAGRLIKIAASATNPRLVGVMFRALAPDDKTHATALRVDVERVHT